MKSKQNIAWIALMFLAAFTDVARSEQEFSNPFVLSGLGSTMADPDLGKAADAFYTAVLQNNIQTAASYLSNISSNNGSLEQLIKKFHAGEMLSNIFILNNISLSGTNDKNDQILVTAVAVLESHDKRGASASLNLWRKEDSHWKVVLVEYSRGIINVSK